MGRRVIADPQLSLFGPTRDISLAAQILRGLQTAEETRCAKKEKNTGKKVTRREVQVPNFRSGPKALCHRRDLLTHVTEYDYDLSDAFFRDYAAARGVLYVAGKLGSERWRLFADPTLPLESFVGDPSFQYAVRCEMDRRKFSKRDLKIQWKILVHGRALLQDCWEIYLAHRAEFVQFQATTRQLDDVVVTRLPKFMNVGTPGQRARLTMFEVFAPGMPAPTKPYFQICYAFDHAREHARAHQVSVWFTRGVEGDNYQLIATFRALSKAEPWNGHAPDRLGWPSGAG